MLTTQLNHLVSLTKWLSVTNEIAANSSPVAFTEISGFAPVKSKNFHGTQATTECRFTPKRVCDTTRTLNQMYHTDKYSQHRSIICPVRLNGCVLVYIISRCDLESRFSHLSFVYIFTHLEWIDLDNVFFANSLMKMLQKHWKEFRIILLNVSRTQWAVFIKIIY